MATFNVTKTIVLSKSSALEALDFETDRIHSCAVVGPSLPYGVFNSDR